MNEIKTAIKKSGIKLKVLAEALEITPVSLNRKINGESKFYVDEALMIMKLTGIDDVHLFYRKEVTR